MLMNKNRFLKLSIKGNQINVSESKLNIDTELKINMLKSVLEKYELKHIKELRSLPYKEYLKSTHWQKLRERIIIKYNRKCQLCCNDELLEVHHNNYDRLGEELESDLTLLCKKCHLRHHNK